MLPLRKLLPASLLASVAALCITQRVAAVPRAITPGAVFSLPKLSLPSLEKSWIIADFDGDGRPDLLTSSPGAATRSIEVRFGTSRRAPAVFEIAHLSEIRLLPWDIDGDNDLDLIAVSPVTNRRLGIWINDGSGKFAPAEDFPDFDFPASVRDPSVGAPFGQQGNAALLPAEARGSGAAPLPGFLPPADPAGRRVHAERLSSGPGRAIAIHSGRAPPFHTLPR
ncbi:MAG TPA: VCBS repeat-containing protein [Bryobacteraceae bacterium]|jgi:hypothetical protein|nr:VCBS repeat-containing protein [Bryobacteraceae bacterium]